MDATKLTTTEKDNILKELTEWMYINYGDAEFFMCPLCMSIVDLPQKDPIFEHLISCPFRRMIEHG